MSQKNPLLISTGIYRRAFEAEPNWVNAVLELYAQSTELKRRIDGVELNLRSAALLAGFRPSAASAAFAAALPHNSLHYFYLEPVRFGGGNSLSEADRTCLARVKELQGIFDFKLLVLHPFPYNLPQVRLLYRVFHDEIGIPTFGFESMLRDQDIPRPDFERLFSESRVRMVLDAAHAAAAETSGSAYSFAYLEPFLSRVDYLHMSSVRRDLAYVDDTGFFCASRGHTLFTETGAEDLKLFDPVRALFRGKPFLGLTLEQD